MTIVKRKNPRRAQKGITADGLTRTLTTAAEAVIEPEKGQGRKEYQVAVAVKFIAAVSLRQSNGEFPAIQHPVLEDEGINPTSRHFISSATEVAGDFLPALRTDGSRLLVIERGEVDVTDFVPATWIQELAEMMKDESKRVPRQRRYGDFARPSRQSTPWHWGTLGAQVRSDVTHEAAIV